MNLLLRILLLIIKGLYIIISPIYWIKYRRRKHMLPEISDPLLLIPATDLAGKIRQQEITSEQICRAYIKRIKEVNPILNAVVEERFESALQEARNIDLYLQTSPITADHLEKSKPLLGVPLTVKESCSLAGLSLSVGTLARRGIKADKDGEAVAKLRASGAIPLLVSNTPEISLSWETNNFITGRTNNPYDITCTSSGSSGGEGALLGAGASLIGIGSDIAGSIRMPALFNGVFGHKPTSRTISIKGHYPYCMDEEFANYFAIGPLTRYPKDLTLMTKIMADDCVMGKLNFCEAVDLSKIKIFYMEEEGKSFLLPSVQKDIKLAIKQSVEHFRNKCRSQIMDNYQFPELKNSCEIAGSVLYGLKNIPNLLKSEKQNLAVELIKSFLGLSAYTYNILMFYTFQYLFKTFVRTDELLRQNDTLKHLFIEKLGQDGVLFYPTFPTSAFKHNMFLFRADAISYLMIFNSMGLPATHVPCGFDDYGLPIGIQVVAAPYQDKLCLAVAEELGKLFGGWKPANPKESNSFNKVIGF